MANYPAINVTLPPETFEALTSRVRGSRERSATIARDLDRLYAMYRHALREVPLTVGEACLICDVLNGSLMDTSSAAVLWTEVEDGIKLDGMDAKWKVDGQALVAHLKDLDLLHCLALVDAAERFWAGDLNEDARTAVRRYFHTTE